MDDMHDAWFFVGILVFIFLIWIATGGPLRPLAFSGPTLAGPGVLGGGNYLSFPQARYGIGTGSTISLPGSSDGGGVVAGSSGTTQTTSFLVGGTVIGNVSPYRGIVTMNHYVSGAGSTDPKNEFVELHVSQNATVPVDISGWTLESDASGATIVIPKGTEIPASGVINAAQDIILTAGDQVLISSGQSPIGASFRENKCIGYFNTFQKFSPVLPQNCPAPSDELSSSYGSGYIRDAACIDYVNTLPRCQTTLTPPLGVSSACQAFITSKLNYNGCVSAHQNDTDFKGGTWRVFLGRTNAMWRTQHELVKLVDAAGKTVDAFSY